MAKARGPLDFPAPVKWTKLDWREDGHRALHPIYRMQVLGYTCRVDFDPTTLKWRACIGIRCEGGFKSTCAAQGWVNDIIAKRFRENDRPEGRP
jgi:hypothetical protein